MTDDSPQLGGKGQDNSPGLPREWQQLPIDGKEIARRLIELNQRGADSPEQNLAFLRWAGVFPVFVTRDHQCNLVEFTTYNDKSRHFLCVECGKQKTQVYTEEDAGDE